MTFGELYLANENWHPMSTLVLVDDDWEIIEDEIKAYLADDRYRGYEVLSFKDNVVTIKEGKTNE